MNPLTATGALARFAVRRDRLRIALWVAAIFLLVLLGATSTKDLFKTPKDLADAARASRDNPVALAFNGPDQALDTIGGQVAFQIGATSLAIAGLMSVLMISRLTRAEEESGRLDLVRSMPVGAHAPLASAIAVVTAMNVAIGVLVSISLLLLDLPVAGSLVMGASFVGVGMVFVGVTTVTAQVSDSGRVTSGLAGAALGAAFAVRAVGDIGSGALSWLSPIGWAQKARPYAGEQWWPLVLCAACGALLVAGAVSLARRRDVGAGLVAPKPGPATASPGLGRPFGLAVRLQRGTVIWWSVGMLVFGAVYGSLADSVDEFVGDNQSLRDVIARSGAASLTDSYLATSLVVLAVIAAGFSLQAALRVRTEEVGLRSEPLLATPTSRARWLSSHVAVALGGSVVVLAVTSGAMGAAYAVTSGDAGQIPRLLAAGLAYVPALWLLVALAVAGYGLVPRAALLAWVALGLCVVVAFFGVLLGLPHWLMQLSPFEQTPDVPASGVRAAPLVGLTAVAAALLAAGYAGFRRRDVMT